MIEKIKIYYNKIKSVFPKITHFLLQLHAALYFIIFDPNEGRVIRRYLALAESFYKIPVVAYYLKCYNVYYDWKESYMSVFDTFDERDFVLYTFAWQMGVCHGILEWDMDIEIAFWCSLYGFNMSALVWFMWFSKYGR